MATGKKMSNVVSCSFAILPVGDIVLRDLKTHAVYMYDPKPDITTFELAKLIHLFTYARTDAEQFKVDLVSFIKENDLNRHFELIEDPTEENLQ